MMATARAAAALCALLVASSSSSVLAQQTVATAGSTNTTSNSTLAAAGDLIGWFECSAATFEDQLEYVARGASANSLPKAQCAQFKAPLCHAGVCEDAKKSTIDVFIKRIQAKSEPASKPNIWFFQGGPGAASPTMELAMTSLYKELSGNVNVYTMDHRGTGRSTLLDCVASQATTSGSPDAGDLSATEIAACAQELQTKYGDMAAFSVTSAATDIASFITKYQAGSKTFVYGVSYGSALVERLLHLAPPEIVGYVLDGIATTSGAPVTDGMYMSNWDTNFADVAEHFVDLCAKDAKCAGRFTKLSLGATIEAVNNGDMRCSLPFSSSTTSESSTNSRSISAKRLFGRLLMRTSGRAAIPAIAYRLARCSSSDGAALYNLMANYVPTMLEASEEDAFESTLLYYLIVFSEMWEEPTPSRTTLMARYTNASMSTGPIASMLEPYCVFTKSNATACATFARAASYAAAPLAYKKDKYWNVAATIPATASVLLLSGKLDPQTPHRYAERLLTALDGSRKQLVTFEYAAHGTLFASALPNAKAGDATCGMRVLASYVTGGGDLSTLDTACVQTLTMSFEPTKAQAARMFNTSDAYDGAAEYHYPQEPNTLDTSIGATEERYSTAFIGVTIAAAVLVLAAVAVHVRKVLKRRNEAAAAATKSSASDEQQHTAVDDAVVVSPSAADNKYVAVADARV